VAAAQRQRRLAQRQVAFVAAVSHELRTPVSVICSAGENLADGVVREIEQVRRYGGVVRDEGRRLGEMVERVLEFAGADARRNGYRFEPLAVADVVREALAARAALVREAGVEVETHVAEDLVVRADRTALRRALVNLIENGVKYRGDGRWLGIRAATAGTLKGRRLLLTVEDHGLGIAQDELRSLFEPFYRGREAEARQIKGSGLGLALVQGIAKAHGGRVEVHSTPGQGSAFTLNLPAPTEADREEEEPMAELEGGDGSTDPPR